MKKVKKYQKNIEKILLLVLNIFIFSTKAYGQEIDVIPGKNKLALNEKFTITLHFPREFKREFKAYHHYFFPDIADFEKGKTIYLEEEDPKAYKIVQYYTPRKPGTFVVNPVRIRIKDKLYASERVVVKVSAEKNPAAEPEPETKKEEDLEFDEPKPDAFFEVESYKSNVYVGEGFGLSFSFLIAAQNKAELTFIDLGEQRKEFIKKLRSMGCLVEDLYVPEELKLDTVILKDKKYHQWKLYEGVFFPIDSNNIKIPPLEFSVLTYALSKNKNESMERKPLVKSFASKPLFIRVIPVRQNKGKEQLPVGYYKLNEHIEPHKLYTGKSFKYTFTVIGEGNIASLPEPVVVMSEYFDIYAPRVTQEIFRQPGKIVGQKTFTYYVTPKEPGEFSLSHFFRWPYFNTAYGKVDTLSSSLSLKVRGESLKNNYISVNNPGDFYSRINTDSNRWSTLSKESDLKFWTNVSILCMLVLTAVLVLKK